MYVGVVTAPNVLYTTRSTTSGNTSIRTLARNYFQSHLGWYTSNHTSSRATSNTAEVLGLKAMSESGWREWLTKAVEKGRGGTSGVSSVIRSSALLKPSHSVVIAISSPHRLWLEDDQIRKSRTGHTTTTTVTAISSTDKANIGSKRDFRQLLFSVLRTLPIKLQSIRDRILVHPALQTNGFICAHVDTHKHSNSSEFLRVIQKLIQSPLHRYGRKRLPVYIITSQNQQLPNWIPYQPWPVHILNMTPNHTQPVIYLALHALLQQDGNGSSIEGWTNLSSAEKAVIDMAICSTALTVILTTGSDTAAWMFHITRLQHDRDIRVLTWRSS